MKISRIRQQEYFICAACLKDLEARIGALFEILRPELEQAFPAPDEGSLFEFFQSKFAAELNDAYFGYHCFAIVARPQPSVILRVISGVRFYAFAATVRANGLGVFSALIKISLLVV
ncbi:MULTISPECIES: hypothetical protein [unclassified Serratia (in: enterobacteria)]|uniref:hypothetical protein n=1 Tax=unclassified Serratia (in: enterobacteria) TaxID=2647522 RepID=UPI003B429134